MPDRIKKLNLPAEVAELPEDIRKMFQDAMEAGMSIEDIRVSAVLHATAIMAHQVAAVPMSELNDVIGMLDEAALGGEAVEQTFCQLRYLQALKRFKEDVERCIEACHCTPPEEQPTEKFVVVANNKIKSA